MLLIPHDRLQEVANYYRERYNVTVTPEQINKHVTDDELRLEMVEDSYGDTYPREWMLEVLAQAIVGVEWPIYATPQEDSDKFFRLALEKGFVTIE